MSKELEGQAYIDWLKKKYPNMDWPKEGAPKESIDDEERGWVPVCAYHKKPLIGKTKNCPDCLPIVGVNE